jgi:hypothetical protein
MAKSGTTYLVFNFRAELRPFAKKEKFNTPNLISYQYGVGFIYLISRKNNAWEIFSITFSI